MPTGQHLIISFWHLPLLVPQRYQSYPWRLYHHPWYHTLAIQNHCMSFHFTESYSISFKAWHAFRLRVVTNGRNERNLQTYLSYTLTTKQFGSVGSQCVQIVANSPRNCWGILMVDFLESFIPFRIVIKQTIQYACFFERSRSKSIHSFRHQRM